MTQQSQSSAKDFFSALFDFSLTTFVAVRFLKLIYAVVTALIAIVTVVAAVAAFLQGGDGIIFGIGILLVGLVYLIVLRVSIEIIAVLFRINENAAAVAEAVAPGRAAYGGGPGGPVTAALAKAPPAPVAEPAATPPAPPVTPVTGTPTVPPPSP